MNRLDPCFSCELPDCDENHPRCRIRELTRRYHAKSKRGTPDLVTEEEREANNRRHAIWRIERKAEASEGGRPFRRGRTVYAAREAQP